MLQTILDDFRKNDPRSEPTSIQTPGKGPPPKLKGLLLLEEAYPTKYWLGSLPLLADSPIDFTFATLHGRRALHDEAERLGLPTVWLDCRRSVDYPRAVKRLTAMLRAERFDILHLNESIQGALGGIASTLAGTGIRLFHRHHFRIGGAHRLYSSLATTTSHMTIAVSEAVRDRAVRDGARPSSVRVAHNGVPEPRAVSDEETAAIRRQLNIPHEHSIVLALGLLRPEKGQESLLQSVPHLLTYHSAHTIVVVGSEPHRVRDPDAAPGAHAIQLKSMAKRVGGSVRFVDYQIDSAPWYALADVVVVPSHTETFGLVAAEAMSAERPVVCTDAGGLTEIVVDGATGLVVPIRAPERLAGAIAQLLTSPDLRAKYGAAGRARFRDRFTLEAMVTRWTDIYLEAAAAFGTRSSGRKRRLS